MTTAESKITDDAIVNTVTSSKTYKDALSGKVDTSTYNTKMEQLDNSISLKATATEVYTKNQADVAFDAKGSAAKAKSEAISSAKSYTDTAITDMATKEYVTNQGYLTATSDVMTSKVSKNEVISAINQTAESVSINASKINFNGAVTFSSFDSPLQTAINNKAETIDLEDVRTAANNAQTSINNLEIGGRNLIVERNVSNGWVNNSGTLINSSEYIATDYIPVTPGATITFQLWTPSSTQTWIDDTYFDSDKNYITGYDGEYVISNHIVRTYTVPAGASYVRMSYGWATGYKVKLEKGNKPTDWTPAQEDVEYSIEDVKNSSIEELNAFSEQVTEDISTINNEIINLNNTDSNIQKFSEDNSLIARGFASIINGILTLQNADSNFSLRLDNEGLILLNGNTKVAYLVVDESLGSALKAENTIQSTIKLRTANGSKGNMGIVARTIGDTGHVSLKAVK